MTLARLAPSLGVLCLISLAQTASGAPVDSYILSQGGSSFSTNCSLQAIEGVRDRLSGSFLWVRRGGKAFLIREERILDDARALFAPLRELEPEQQALARRQERLASEEESIDREQDEIDEELDRLSDDGDKSEREASARRSLERRKRDLEPKRRATQEKDRELEDIDRSIDAREEALEKKIEAKLWRLIDEAIASGVARPDESR